MTEAEQQAVTAGLRSQEAFTLRRCQLLLASASGERVPQIAQTFRCDEQTVRDAIHAFNDRGVAALSRQSSRPKTITYLLAGPELERLKGLLHQSPRLFGKATSVWTLDLLAEVAHSQGLTSTQVSGETIRQSLKRLAVSWRRAKAWITSPDPAYARKKSGGTSSSRRPAPGLPG
jgi:transposase